MILHLARITLSLPRLFAWGGGRGLATPEGDSGYLVHCVLRRALGPDGPQPFAVDPDGAPADGSTMRVYGYTGADAARLRAALGAAADRAAAAAVLALEARAMPAHWPTGRLLRFATRVCPVLRQDREGRREKSRETDAFLVAAGGMSPDERPLRREEVYRRWLARQLARDGAAELLEARLVAYRRVRLRHGASRRTMTKPDARFEGLLAVRDGAAFHELLARGIGRHRVFGFGMLLLRAS
ncbi:MAG: hypothetical protein KatS3mg119_2171 [Rhodothalassiaceae bacterium]|nr:MAG: hypothetical protein KatS3mg119_2171 [Rhodothalassiaceae bacterium]